MLDAAGTWPYGSNPIHSKPWHGSAELLVLTLTHFGRRAK
jgi:hypothetical protein